MKFGCAATGVRLLPLPPIWFPSIHVGGEILPGVEVVGDLYGQEILLGRDVLNKLLLLIDGPHQRTDILARRPDRRGANRSSARGAAIRDSR